MNRYYEGTRWWVWCTTGVAYPTIDNAMTGAQINSSVVELWQLLTFHPEITPARARELTGCWCYERNSD